LRVDALAIPVIGIADHAVIAIGVAHRAARSILLPILVRPIRVVETPLGADHCETSYGSDDQEHSHSHSHTLYPIEVRHNGFQPASDARGTYLDCNDRDGHEAGLYFIILFMMAIPVWNLF
jgi:hypothetical protein